MISLPCRLAVHSARRSAWRNLQNASKLFISRAIIYQISVPLNTIPLPAARIQRRLSGFRPDRAVPAPDRIDPARNALISLMIEKIRRICYTVQDDESAAGQQKHSSRRLAGELIHTGEAGMGPTSQKMRKPAPETEPLHAGTGWQEEDLSGPRIFVNRCRTPGTQKSPAAETAEVSERRAPPVQRTRLCSHERGLSGI